MKPLLKPITKADLQSWDYDLYTNNNPRIINREGIPWLELETIENTSSNIMLDN